MIKTKVYSGVIPDEEGKILLEFLIENVPWQETYNSKNEVMRLGYELNHNLYHIEGLEKLVFKNKTLFF